MIQEFKRTILSAIFIAGLLAANLLGSKITTLFGIAVSVGIFAYPLTFLMTDALAEVYGKCMTKQLIYAALIAQILVFLLTYIAVILPPASRFTNNDAYVTIFHGSLRVIAASLIAFLVSQMHDIWAFEFWKAKTKGKFLWLRNNLSTMVSQAIDTLLFMFIAFYHINDRFTAGFILQLAVTYWLFKIAFAVLDTPIVYLLVRWLKKPDTKTSSSSPSHAPAQSNV